MGAAALCPGNCQVCPGSSFLWAMGLTQITKISRVFPSLPHKSLPIKPPPSVSHSAHFVQLRKRGILCLLACFLAPAVLWGLQGRGRLGRPRLGLYPHPQEPAPWSQAAVFPFWLWAREPEIFCPQGSPPLTLPQMHHPSPMAASLLEALQPPHPSPTLSLTAHSHQTGAAPGARERHLLCPARVA